MAYVKQVDVRDAVTNLTRLLSSESDPLTRLSLILSAQRDVDRELTRLRNSSAYEARTGLHTLMEIEQATGVNHASIGEWVKKHMRVTGAPRPRRRRRRDEIAVRHDLSQGEQPRSG